jgi:hypothetical protein
MKRVTNYYSVLPNMDHYTSLCCNGIQSDFNYLWILTHSMDINDSTMECNGNLANGYKICNQNLMDFDDSWIASDFQLLASDVPDLHFSFARLARCTPSPHLQHGIRCANGKDP